MAVSHEGTARRQARAALEASERFLRESQRVGRIGSYDFDIVADRWHGSEVLDEILGVGPNDPHTVSTWLEQIHPDDREGMARYLTEEVLGQGRPFDREYRILSRDTGDEKWVHGLGRLEFDATGRPVRMIGTIQDITERRRAAAALADSERTYREIFNATSDALFIHDETGRVVDVNERACAMFRCSRETLLTESLDSFSLGTPPYSQVEAAALVGRALSIGPQVFTWRSRRLDGELFWSEVALRSALIGGRPRIIAAVRDVTDRKQAEAELRQSERRLSLAISATADAIWDWDLVTNQTFYSPRWYSMLGYRDQEIPMTYESWRTLCHPDDVQPTLDRIQATLNTPGSTGYVAEFRMQHRDGSWRWIQGRGNVVERDTAGQPVRMSGTNSDITEEKRAVMERDRLFAMSQDMLCIAGFDGHLMHVNPAWTRVLGWSAEEMTSRPWLWFVHPDDQAATIRAGERLLAGGTMVGFENRYRCKDGSWRLLSWNSSSLMEDHLIYCAVRDLTDQRHNEERLRQMEKMEAVGQLAGGIAHDFNNQLGAIMGFAEMLGKRLEDPVQRRYLANILTATQRSADLTGQLLAFSRKGQYLKVAVDMHAVIAETVAIVARSMDRRIHFQQILNGRPALVAGDPSQLQNMLLNLALNARDAMPEGGTLTFETAVVRASAAAGESEPGDQLEVRVSDTGSGMSAEVQAHLFEPFFTTKAPGKGTGMGLAAVYGTVRNHGGTITVTSVVGQGTCFRVLLPMTSMPADVAVSPAPAAHMGQRGILIIDDEPLVRDLTGELLKDEGHTVFMAAHGVEGVALFEAHRQDIDLVILDMVMPEMNGRDCFRALKALAPTVRVLLVSGYSLDGDARAILAEGAAGFIQKPFQRDELLRKLAELLVV